MKLIFTLTNSQENKSMIKDCMIDRKSYSSGIQINVYNLSTCHEETSVGVSAHFYRFCPWKQSDYD